MDTLLLSRWQFALTSSFHFLFVPLTLGLSIIVAIMETLYVRTGQEHYKSMARFWGKLFIVNFAMGVVTGIVQEFHFGMNWSEYARFVGDIFGAPLAIEALAAFFLESTFIAVWVFGWEKISKNLHLASIWIVALASNLSAFWILVANSFMQEPVGFVLRNGRAEMVDFGALITNPHVFYQFGHTVLGGFATGAVFVLGVSAYHLLRSHEISFFKTSLKIAAVFGVIALLGGITIGHLHGQYLGKVQPMKMAAANSLWETSQPAPLNLIAVPNEKEKRNDFAVSIPGVESFMMTNDFNARVEGMNDLQNAAQSAYGAGSYIPPVSVVFWSFRIMLGFGSLLLAICLLALLIGFAGESSFPRWLLQLMVIAIPFPFITNIAGWSMAEVGRQPWIVYGLQRVDQAVSLAVPASSVVLSLAVFCVLFTVLAVINIVLMARIAGHGPELTEALPGVAEISGKEVASI